MTRVLCLLLLLTGCAHHPARVSCTGHLQAINGTKLPISTTPWAGKRP
jgi:hypothetical protein